MNSNKRGRRYLTVIALVLSLFIVLKLTCGIFLVETIKVEGILEAEVQPRDGKNIFFIESGEETDDVRLNPREACAIESAALLNPQLNVFVLFASRERLRALRITPAVKALMSYGNVFINFIDMFELSKGSPMEDFIRSEKLQRSKFKVEHTSDVLRLLVLWKFGGTYLDLDMIARKNLESVPSNFACRQNEEQINGAILNFDRENGRNLSELFISSLVRSFNGEFFVTNGPALLTQVLHKLCGTKDMDRILEMGSCEGFNVLDISMCYEISYHELKNFMDEKFTAEILRRVENSIAVHLWNHESGKFRVDVESNTPLIALARQSCPNVIASCDGIF